MVNFQSYGKLKYFEEYKIDKNIGVIAKFKAYITDLSDDITSAIIEAERIVDDNMCHYDTTVHFFDKSGKEGVMQFPYSYILRLDTYRDTIVNLYNFRIKKSSGIDAIMTEYTYGKATVKDEYTYEIKPFVDINGKDIKFNINRENTVIRIDNELTVKYNRSVVERIIVTDYGIVTDMGNTIIVSAFNNKINKYENVKFKKFVTPETKAFNCVPALCKLPTEYYRNNKLDDTMYLEYDMYGIEKTDSSLVGYDCYCIMTNADHIEQYSSASIHPLFLDLSNLGVSFLDNLYAVDYCYDGEGEDDDRYSLFTREVREVSSEEVDKISEEIVKCKEEKTKVVDPYLFEEIIENVL